MVDDHVVEAKKSQIYVWFSISEGQDNVKIRFYGLMILISIFCTSWKELQLWSIQLFIAENLHDNC